MARADPRKQRHFIAVCEYSCRRNETAASSLPEPRGDRDCAEPRGRAAASSSPPPRHPGGRRGRVPVPPLARFLRSHKRLTMKSSSQRPQGASAPLSCGADAASYRWLSARRAPEVSRRSHHPQLPNCPGRRMASDLSSAVWPNWGTDGIMTFTNSILMRGGEKE